MTDKEKIDEKEFIQNVAIELTNANLKEREKIVKKYYKLFQHREQALKNEKLAAQNDIEILNQACVDLRNELEEREQECEKLKQALEKIASSDICTRCDGVGFSNGCEDANCAYYIANKALVEL